MLCAEPDLMGSRQTGVRVRPASKDTAPVGFRGIEQCLADLLRFRRRDVFQPAPICRGRLRFEASPIFQERVSRGKLGSLRLGRGCRFQMHVFFRNVAFWPDSQAIRRSAVFAIWGNVGSAARKSILARECRRSAQHIGKKCALGTVSLLNWRRAFVSGCFFGLHVKGCIHGFRCL